MSRPFLLKMLKHLQPGDTVLVYKIDRVARSLKDLMVIIERIQNSGAQFRSLTEIIDTSAPAGRMMLQIIGTFAEFERELIRERTAVGMRAAMARGAKFGRERGMSPEDEAECVRLFGTRD